MGILNLFHRIFIVNWARKVVALFAAFILWFSVNQSLTTTKTFSDVPIKIINLPKGKTILGLQPNGLLKKRLSVTVRGNKSFLAEINPQTLELVINAEGREEGWIPKIDKSTLTSLSPHVDLQSHISSVESHNIFLPVTELVTDEILITITEPLGDPPKGYQFVGVWPKYIRQKVTGAAEDIKLLKENGLELTFDLDRISEEELDQLSGMNSSSTEDEISFYVPKTWKQIQIDSLSSQPIMLNDPAAKYLRILFLKQELLSLAIELPLTPFFPVQYSKTLNPQTYSLEINEVIQKKQGLTLFTLPLYVQDVSRLFLDVVRNHLLLTIIVVPKNIQTTLDWSLECVDQDRLEDAFVTASLHEAKQKELSLINESYLRSRFRHYLRQLKLYQSKDQPLNLEATLDTNLISVKVLS